MTCDLFLLICVFSSLLNVDSSADYTNVNPRYGTLEDWDRLLKGCHDRGMKLMMDLVVNHTSDEVRFLLVMILLKLTMCFSTRGSKNLATGAKTKLIIRNATGTSGGRQRMIPKGIANPQTTGFPYLQVRPDPRSPSLLSSLCVYYAGSAWEYDEPSNEYYLHLFATKQPDLNWENEGVREAVWGVMNFWISRGCDGFRVRCFGSICNVEETITD